MNKKTITWICKRLNAIASISFISLVGALGTLGCDNQSSIDGLLDGDGEEDTEPEPEQDAPPVDAGPPPEPDTVGPTITLLTPEDDCLTGVVTISFSVEDTESGVGFARAEFAGNNLTTEEVEPGVYSTTFDTSNLFHGFHKLFLVAGDTENNISEIERTYGVAQNGDYLSGADFSCGDEPDGGAAVVDETPPEVTLVLPAPGMVALVSDEINISVQVTDDVGPVTVVAECGGSVSTLTGANTNYSGTVNTAGLSEGSYTLTVTATDEAQRSSSVTAEIKIDQTAPTVVITEPQSGDTRVALTDVVAQANDENGIERVLLYESGNPELLGLAVTPAPGTEDVFGIIYQLPCNNLPRATTFEMHAYDNAGNSSVATVSVTVTSEGCGD